MQAKQDKIGLLDFDKADLSVARTHQRACLVRNIESKRDYDRDDICPCCSLPKKAPLFSISCPISSLSELGIGFPLFYYFAKSVIFLSLLASLIVALPCAYSNIRANDENPFILQPSIWYHSTFVPEDDKLPIWQTWLNSGFCVFMIFYMFILKRFLKRKTLNFDLNTTTPSDFTVWVRNLPIGYKVEDLKKFLIKKAVRGNQEVEISAICPVYDIDFYVQQIRELEKFKGLQSYVEDYRKKYRKNPSSCFGSKKYNLRYLKSNINRIQKWLEEFETKNKKYFSTTNSVFVTFRRQDIAKQTIKNWRRSLCEQLTLLLFNPCICLCCCCFTRWKFKGKILKIKRAAEPSDLIWENLSTSSSSKFCRGFLMVLFTIALLIALTFVVFQVKMYQYNLHKQAEEETISTLRVRSMNILMSLIIISVGRIIAITTRLFTSYEKHYSWTGYHLSVANKLIFAMSLNSIGVLLLVNFLPPKNVPGIIPGANNDDDSSPLFEEYGLASDLFWLLCTDAVVSPLTYILSPLYIARVCKRRSVKKLAKKGIVSVTQREANEIFENPPVDMAQRYANYMKTLFITFFFAPIFPIGLLIGTISMTLQYWTDKYLFLRRHPRPPNLGSKLSDNILRWMPILILIYSASNILTYYILTDIPEGATSWVPFGVFAFSVFFFIFPCKCSCLKVNKKKITHDENDFEVQNLEFVEDYQRSNPVTSRTGWKEWLDLIEKKKGREEKNILENKFKERIPGVNCSVHQYALKSEYEGGSIVQPRKSTSVLKDYMRMSNPQYDYVDFANGMNADLGSQFK